MDHGACFRTGFIDAEVEGIFHGGFVFADDGAVCLHAHDVCGGEGAFIHAAGADPHIAVFVEDGEVAAAGGGHSVIIDPLHVAHDLFCGMFVIDSAHFSELRYIDLLY